MNKSFPTVPLYRPLRWLGIASVAVLTGCVGYYPDSYPSSPQPYYGGGSGGGYYDSYDNGYYSPGYYGPAYGASTIYYQSYSPGYYYRPGYGYYPPAPRPSRPPSGGGPRGPSHSDNVKDNWADRFDGTTGSNPSRYPHDGRNDNRNNDRGDNRPSPSSPGQPRPSNGNNDRGGWGNRIGQSNNNPAPRPAQQAPQAPRPSAPPPQRSEDRGSRGAWADRLRDKSN